MSSSAAAASKVTDRLRVPCAGCKKLGRNCFPGCVFAPYFPPQDEERFFYVHSVFGASSVANILGRLEEPEQRACAVKSLVGEAQARLRNPTLGCVSHIDVLRMNLERVKGVVAADREKLAALVGREAAFQPFDASAAPPAVKREAEVMLKECLLKEVVMETIRRGRIEYAVAAAQQPRQLRAQQYRGRTVVQPATGLAFHDHLHQHTMPGTSGSGTMMIMPSLPGGSANANAFLGQQQRAPRVVNLPRPPLLQQRQQAPPPHAVYLPTPQHLHPVAQRGTGLAFHGHLQHHTMPGTSGSGMPFLPPPGASANADAFLGQPPRPQAVNLQQPQPQLQTVNVLGSQVQQPSVVPHQQQNLPPDARQ